MMRLWIFWLEILGFSLYAVWRLSSGAPGGTRTGYQWANLVIYGLALAYGSFGFFRFARRRLRARDVHRS